jgi:hypothetical protein
MIDGRLCAKEGQYSAQFCTLREICLTLCGRAFLEKLTVAPPLRKYPAIDGTQERGTGIFLSEMNSAHDVIIDSSGNYFNITITSTPMSPKFSHSD